MLAAVGSHLGVLAGRDLAARCAEGLWDPRGRAVSRRERKRALTAGSSSRWAGAITRTSEDQWQLADRNLRAERVSLLARVRRIGARAAVPAGGKAGPGPRPAPKAASGPGAWPFPREARARVPPHGLRHPDREVPRPAGADDRQRGPVGDRRRSCLYVEMGRAALARPAARASPRDDRAPRGSAGARATRARPPGQAPRDREPHRPGGRGTASPGADQEKPGSQARTQETRHPTRPPAATPHQDQAASPDHGRRPGSPGPSGAAGYPGPSPAISIRNGVHSG